MANVSVLNTTGQLSGKTIAVCENDQTITGAWTFSGNQTFNGNVTIGNASTDTLTVTSTIVSNLIFTDATYDIGASGATRPRDLFLSRNATVGGTLAVTGVATFTAVPVFNGTGATTFNGDVVIAGTTPLLTIGDAGEEDTAVLFDGNAQDYHIGLDDSSDSLVIGLGSALGTTPAITINASQQVTANAGILPRVNGTTSSATPTPNADTTDLYNLTALAEAAAFGAPTGTPYNGQKLIIRIKDNGTARALTWNASYVAGGVSLPSTTVISKILHIGFIYNTDNSLNKWMCVAVAQEA